MFIRLPKLKLSARVRGMLRVVVYLSCLNLAFTAVYATRAHAQAEQTVQRTGLELLRQLGPTIMGPTQGVELNGQPMFLSSQATRHSVSEVLEAFERHCENPAGAPTEPAPKPAVTIDTWDFSRLLISRLEEQDGSVGQVGCVAARERDKTFDGFVKRLAKFVSTLDLAELGDMRYAVARRDKKTGVTQVLAMWTEGSLNIPAMFPAAGDAPGSDSRHAPRPPEAVRVLSAEVNDHPYALRQYDTSKSVSEVLDFYTRSMPARGWRTAPLPAQPGTPTLNDNLRVFMEGGAAILVVANVTPEGKTGVSLVELGTAGHVRAAAYQ
ncbi:MAG TPA: hypothetical protein VER33_20325 [Polyangiaceae bacterium]|nr:hypothetical protein [Polyangiaceae bacterium]